MTDTTRRRPALTSAMIRALHRFFAAQLHLINAPVARASNGWIHDRTLTALMRNAWIVSCGRLPSAGAVLTDDALRHLERRGDDDMVPDVRRLAVEQRMRDQFHAIAIAFRNEYGEAASTTYSETYAAQLAMERTLAGVAAGTLCTTTRNVRGHVDRCQLDAGHPAGQHQYACGDAPSRLVPATNYLDRGDDQRDHAEEAAVTADLEAEAASELRYEAALDALDRLDDVLQLLAAGGRRTIDDTDVYTADYVSVLTARRQLVTAIAPELNAHDVINHAAGTYVSTRAALEALRSGRADLVARVAEAFDVPPALLGGSPRGDEPAHLEACTPDGELILCADGCPLFAAVAGAALAEYVADERWTYTGTPGLFRLGDERSPQVHARAVPGRPGRFTVSILGRDVDDVERAPDGEWRPVGGGTE